MLPNHTYVQVHSPSADGSGKRDIDSVRTSMVLGPWGIHVDTYASGDGICGGSIVQGFLARGNMGDLACTWADRTHHCECIPRA